MSSHAHRSLNLLKHRSHVGSSTRSHRFKRSQFFQAKLAHCEFVPSFFAPRAICSCLIWQFLSFGPSRYLFVLGHNEEAHKPPRGQFYLNQDPIPPTLIRIARRPCSVGLSITRPPTSDEWGGEKGTSQMGLPSSQGLYSLP